MHIGRMEKDLEKLGEWYWLGYRDAQALMPDLRAYLARKNGETDDTDEERIAESAAPSEAQPAADAASAEAPAQDR